LRGGGTDTGQQVQYAEASDTVAWILDEPQQCKHVLDVRRVEEFETAEFHERDIAAGEFDFQRSAVRGRAEEYSLLLEEGSFLAVLENPLDDVARLVCLVAHGDQPRFCR
jgi:hypothetical protein